MTVFAKFRHIFGPPKFRSSRFRASYLCLVRYTYTLVTVKVVCTILYSPETSLQWAARYSINPQSRFPDHSAESTEEDCIGKALSALL